VADIDDLCGRVLGEFVLRELIVEGGFGTVYRADQEKLRRAAVVKILRRRAPRRDVSVQRFAREALLSSQLDHPYAAHVYAFGVELDGLVWIAMELVQGVTLTDWLKDRGPMPLDQFVPFFQRLAEVVHAAHERGIVHRDLKPSNVMIIERAGQLLPKLLDFGVAMLLDGVTVPHLEIAEELVITDDTPRELAAVSGADAIATVRLRPPSTPNRPAGHRLTGASVAIGSPPYMAPEQWVSRAAVAPAMDLYALGVLTYEVLTGRTPFTARTGPEYAELHRNAPVPALGADLAALDPALRRALAKSPDERFHSALDFAAALRNELEARLIAQVRPAARHWQDRGRPSGLLWREDALSDLVQWIERTGAGALNQLELDFAEASRAHAEDAEAARRRRSVWIRRGVISAAIATVAIIAAILQSRANTQADEAEQRARMTQEFADLSARQAEVEQGRAALLHGELLEAQQHLSEAYRSGDHSAATEFMLARTLQATMAERAQLKAGTGRMWSAIYAPDGERIVTTDDGQGAIWDVQTSTRIATLPHRGSVYQALYSTDGSRIYTSGADGTVRIWSAGDGSPIATLTTELDERSPARYLALALSPDGTLVAAIASAGDRVQVWNANTPAAVATLRISGTGFPSIAFVDDGRSLVVGGGEDVTVFATQSWKPIVTVRGPGIHTVTGHPRRPWIATGTVGGDVSIRDARNGARIRHVREVGDAVDRLTFSPDGRLLAVASRDAAIQVMTLDTGTLRSTGIRVQGSTIAFEFDLASRVLLAAGGAGSVVVADVSIGTPLATLEGAKGAIYAAHFDRSSHRIVAASWDGTARVWDATSPYRVWAAPAQSADCGLFGGADPDERFVAIGCRDLPTQVWDTAEHRLMAKLPHVTHVDGDYSSAYPVVSADGTRAAVARANTVEIYELPGGRLVRTVPHSAAVNAVAFARSGRALVSGSVDGGLFVTSDQHEPRALGGEREGIDVVGLLPNGKIVAADAGLRLRIFNAAGEVVLATFTLAARARAFRISADGRRLVTLPRMTAPPSSPELWDLQRQQRVGELSGHVGGVYAARFSGDMLVTAGADGVVRMWDSETARVTHTYAAHTRTLTDVDISPDGQFVAAGGGDGSIRFWDREGGRLLWQQSAARSAIAAIHFQGQDLVVRGFGGDVSRWTLPPAQQVIDEYERRQRAASRP
jgi:eukaryotic-like serine/threonine-protein kinase